MHKKLIVHLGTTSPIKVSSFQKAFYRCFNNDFIFIPHQVNSNVGPQPNTLIDIRQGALNRINNLKRQFPTGDFYAAIEGGTYPGISGKSETMARAIIENQQGIRGEGSTGGCVVPHQ